MNRLDHWSAYTTPVEINVLLNSGGMGDQICRLPALRTLLTKYPHVMAHVYAPEYIHELLNYFFGRFPKFILHKKEDQAINFPKRPTYWFIGKEGTQMHPHFHSTLGTHLVDFAFRTLLDRDPEIDERDYLKVEGVDRPVGGPYMVLTPGFTSYARALPAETWNGIAAHLSSKGVTPVWAGKRGRYAAQDAQFYSEIDYSVGLDLREKTTLLGLARIMAGAKAVVGLDNGLLHLAGLTDTNIIAGYSSVKAKFRLPIRQQQLGLNVYVVEPDTCHGCENIVRFDYEADFRYCRYGDYICTKELTTDKWNTIIDLVLGGTKNEGPV